MTVEDNISKKHLNIIKSQGFKLMKNYDYNYDVTYEQTDQWTVTSKENLEEV